MHHKNVFFFFNRYFFFLSHPRQTKLHLNLIKLLTLMMIVVKILVITFKDISCGDSHEYLILVEVTNLRFNFVSNNRRQQKKLRYFVEK